MQKTRALMGRLAAIYGGRWAMSYATPAAIELAIHEWEELVKHMSDEQLQRGVGWAKVSSPWPPSLAEFLQAALAIDEEQINAAALAMLPSWDRQRLTHWERDAWVRQARDRAMVSLVEQRLTGRWCLRDQPPETRSVAAQARIGGGGLDEAGRLVGAVLGQPPALGRE